MTGSWSDLELSDVGFRAYVQRRVAAELARAWVDVSALQIERAHDRDVIDTLQAKVKALEEQLKEKGKKR